MMLIHPEIGSFTFIGVVLTDADLAADLPFEADRCGTCRRCLDACPTQAFVGPRDLDARACISYLTIEHRGEFDATQRAEVGDWLFGCDVCQDVCPWNVSFAQATQDPGFAPRTDIARPDAGQLATIDEAEFQRRYAGTPFTRPGHTAMPPNRAGGPGVYLPGPHSPTPAANSPTDSQNTTPPINRPDGPSVLGVCTPGAW